MAIIKLIETIQMSLWGTTIGAILSLPIAIFSARNLAPFWLQILANGLQNLVRSIPSLVLGLLKATTMGIVLLVVVIAIDLLSSKLRKQLESME